MNDPISTGLLHTTIDASKMHQTRKHATIGIDGVFAFRWADMLTYIFVRAYPITLNNRLVARVGWSVCVSTLRCLQSINDFMQHFAKMCMCAEFDDDIAAA